MGREIGVVSDVKGVLVGGAGTLQSWELERPWIVVFGIEGMKVPGGG